MIWLLSLFLATHPPCVGSIYATPSDRSNHGVTAAGHDPRTTPGFAHRTLPLRSWALVCYRRCARLQVIDRGPYGKITASGRWVNGARSREPGTWRGCADLTPLGAARIGLRGLSPIRVVPLRR